MEQNERIGSGEQNRTKPILNPASGEGQVDLKSYLYKLLSFWPLFFIFLGGALTIAFMANRYSTQLFKTSVSLLISEEDASSGGGLEALMSAIGYSDSKMHLENEILVLKSRYLMEQTIKNFGVQVSYFGEGRIRVNEIFGRQPFLVEFDEESLQPIRSTFNVTYLEEGRFRIETLEEPWEFIRYSSEERLNLNDIGRDAISELNGEYEFGEWITGGGYDFRLMPNTEEGKKVRAGDRFRFMFNDPSGLINAYKNRLNIDLSAEGSSGIRISLIGSVPDKDRAFLNQFAKAFIAYDLKQENLITESTLRFISSELQHIEDSLFRVEQMLEDFRVENKTVNLSTEGQTIFNRLNDFQLQESEEVGKKRYFQFLLNLFEEQERETATQGAMLPPPVIGIGDPSVVNLITQLNTLYAHRQQMTSSLKTNNPQLRQMEAEIVAMEKLLEANVRAAIKQCDVRLSEIQGRIRLLESRMEGYPSTERSLVNIQRKFQLNENLYMLFLEKQAETQIALASNVPRNRILDRAWTDESAVAPNRVVNFGLALLLGLLIPDPVHLGQGISEHQDRGTERSGIGDHHSGDRDHIAQPARFTAGGHQSPQSIDL